MSTNPEVVIERLPPEHCDWPNCMRAARYRVELEDRAYDVCGRHRQSTARFLLRERARAERRRERERRAQEQARQRARDQQAARDQALRQRIVATHDAGEVYPLVLPPGVPEAHRAQIIASIIERG